jgi:hypothetical protein
MELVTEKFVLIYNFLHAQFETSKLPGAAAYLMNKTFVKN